MISAIDAKKKLDTKIDTIMLSILDDIDRDICSIIDVNQGNNLIYYIGDEINNSVKEKMYEYLLNVGYTVHAITATDMVKFRFEISW